MSITLIIPCVVVGMALMHDAHQTVQLVTAVVTVRGITWLVTRISNINKTASEMIDFTGWSLAGIFGVGLIKLAIVGIPEVLEKYAHIVDGFNKFAAWVDKITFWN